MVISRTLNLLIHPFNMTLLSSSFTCQWQEDLLERINLHLEELLVGGNLRRNRDKKMFSFHPSIEGYLIYLN